MLYRDLKQKETVEARTASCLNDFKNETLNTLSYEESFEINVQRKILERKVSVFFITFKDTALLCFFLMNH